MEFRYPAFFLLLLGLPLLFYYTKRRRQTTLAFSTVQFLSGGQTPPSLRVLLFRLLPVLRFSVLALFILALARPQKVTAEREYQRGAEATPGAKYPSLCSGASAPPR